MFQKLLDKMKVTKETYENEFAEMFGKKAIGIDLFEIGEKILINAYGEMETDAAIQNTINEVVFEYSGNEGIITRQDAINKLTPILKSNIRDVMIEIGKGNYGVDLTGTSGCMKKVLDNFKEDI